MHDRLNICQGHNAHRFSSSQIQFKNVTFILRQLSLPHRCIHAFDFQRHFSRRLTYSTN